MKEKIYLEKKDSKVIAYFMGTQISKGNRDIKEVKKKLEGEGYIVELKE